MVSRRCSWLAAAVLLDIDPTPLVLDEVKVDVAAISAGTSYLYYQYCAQWHRQWFSVYQRFLHSTLRVLEANVVVADEDDDNVADDSTLLVLDGMHTAAAAAAIFVWLYSYYCHH